MIFDAIKELFGARPALSRVGEPITNAERESGAMAVAGQVVQIPHTKSRWITAELDDAESLADNGDLSMAAALINAMRRKGIVAGVMSTRASVVQLPRLFGGNPDAIAALTADDGTNRKVFDLMLPPAELAALGIDGFTLGVGVGLLEPVPGRDYPVLRRLDPGGLRWLPGEGRWYYQTLAGMVAVTPGDGRWVLHIAGPVVHPWRFGLWRALGAAFIRCDNAASLNSNWEATLANPARVAVAPQGAADEQKQAWWRALLAWRPNAVFGVTPGYDVKLLESNGQGSDSFNRTITREEREIVIAITGSTVLVDGGTGFANADVHAAIRRDLIASDADALAFTCNTQVLPQWCAQRFGGALGEHAATVAWDVTPPGDRKAFAEASAAEAGAVSAWATAAGASFDAAVTMARKGLKQ